MEKLKERSRPSTLAQDVMREELDLKKKKSKAAKQQRIQEQFDLKQKKQKRENKGH